MSVSTAITLAFITVGVVLFVCYVVWDILNMD